jgi:protocatechuate 3,4-dioxygenase beta subunit
MVIDTDHVAVSGAQVCAVCAGNASQVAPPSFCVATDTAGHYRLSGLPGDTYAVTASADAFVAAPARDGDPVPVGRGEAIDGVDIVLAHGGARLDGTVTDATGGPIAHAAVQALHSLSPRTLVTAYSDDRGRFVLWLPSGSTRVSASADGYAPTMKSVLAPAGGVDLVLTPGGTMRGVVVSPTGEGVPNVEVRAVPVSNQGITTFQSAATGQEGAFTVRGLQPDTYTLVATGAGWRGQLAEPVPLALAATVEGLRIVVRPAAQLTGHVQLAGDHSACPQGFVRLGWPDPTQPPPENPSLPPVGGPGSEPAAQLTATIGAGGAVRFPAVPAGTYDVTVQCLNNVLRDGPRVLRVPDDAIGDAIGDANENLVWTVGPGASLTVAVVDAAGLPVPQAIFVLRMPQWTPGTPPTAVSGRVGDDGRFSYPAMLHPGTYEVGPGALLEGDPVRVELSDRDENVEAKLHVAGSAAIVATVRTDGVSADGLRVTAFAEVGSGDSGAPNSLHPAAAAAALGGGRYRVGPLKAGRYRVQVDDGLNPSLSSKAVTVADGDVVEIGLGLRRDARIRGQVLGEDGLPVPNVWVSALPTDRAGAAGALAFPIGPAAGGGLGRVLTDPDGRFVLARLASGALYALRADQPSGASVTTKEGVPAAESTEVVLTLPSLGTIQGLVVDDAGRPVAGARVRAESTGRQGSMVAQISDADGQFTLRAVAPGHVDLRCSRESEGSFEMGQATADLSPGQALTGVQVVLRPLAVALRQPPGEDGPAAAPP